MADIDLAVPVPADSAHPGGHQRRMAKVITSPDGAALARVSRPFGLPGAPPTAVVLVLHGGGDQSTVRPGWPDPAVLRLWPVARVIARSLPAAAVSRLKFSVRGWNDGGAEARRDARWAVTTLRAQYPGLPIVLVGHSLGGRVALRIGGDDGIAGVVLLAPWAPTDEPAAQLAGQPVVMVQGGRDRVIPESTTRAWVARAELAGARVHRTLLPWAGHTMLRRFWVWHRLAAAGVSQVLVESKIPAPDQSRPS